MAKMVFPGNVQDGYFPGSNDKRSAADENYYLCIGTNMRIFCLIQYSPNKPFQRAYWSDPIEPEDFQHHSVEEGNIGDLVRKKLDEIESTGC
jgi:hypothetical protein